MPASWSKPAPRPDKWSYVLEEAHFSHQLSPIVNLIQYADALESQVS